MNNRTISSAHCAEGSSLSYFSTDDEFFTFMRGVLHFTTDGEIVEDALRGTAGAWWHLTYAPYYI
jgi:hypothetical protein